MKKGNIKFTTRVNNAVESLNEDRSLGLVRLKSGSMFSPAYRNGNYEWVKVMDSDGMLVCPRKVKAGEGAELKDEVSLLVGVVVQSEDSTSQTKPNPLGKASIGHITNGIWVDVSNEGRKRLDRLIILMLLPKGAAPARQKAFATAKRNVENAAAMMPDCEVLIIERGASSEVMAKEIKKIVRPLFKGRGRPKYYE